MTGRKKIFKEERKVKGVIGGKNLKQRSGRREREGAYRKRHVLLWKLIEFSFNIYFIPNFFLKALIGQEQFVLSNA